MVNGIKTGDPCGFNKGKVQSSMQVPEFDKQLKKAGGPIGQNNKHEDNSLKTLHHKKSYLLLMTFMTNEIQALQHQ